MESRDVERLLARYTETGTPASALRLHRAIEALGAERSEDAPTDGPGGGRARKVSVSMPQELTAAVRQRVGSGEFSRYVTEAVARRLETDLLVELVALLEEEYGPVDEAALAEAEALWPDTD
ncbi:hypothetical protein SAMN05421803_110139 [Nocardiopsis flavescens]|uniref:CopG family transcriptional regulator n=1 Tax=Nocardiopsis flavescens TaxID=758803 RepID=A0A1M6MP03_9ACTN|nr:hypothetical protein [Nocardiopsis flavescens]SHJ85110.1 hypothetical protein SAMN05421803_110139 [Nocardiopsis flavescens]